MALLVVAAVVRRVKNLTAPLPPSPKTLRIRDLVRVVGGLPPEGVVASSGQTVVARCKLPPQLHRRKHPTHLRGGKSINRRASHGVSTYKLLGNVNSMQVADQGNLPYGYGNLERSSGFYVQWS